MEESNLRAFSSAYAGSLRYYAEMLRKDSPIAINLDEKRLSDLWMHNHTRIAGANGPLILTIPLVKTPKNHTPICDIKISEHGDWERIHWGAIFSAYGKAPFFEYIEPDLKKLYDTHSNWLIDFNMSMHELIVNFLDLPITASVMSITNQVEDCQILNTKNGKIEYPGVSDIEYYQIWKDKNGFIPNLSILDLLMNVGRESIVVLNRMIIK